ncbi:hypothetical protein AGABI2DRAFT_123026 [Agaricus bisporus var. bisporus H97]|uniref:hypothetical protein n=1 Tax=Agaricus bisporus var. bisporus (strain H97 / ATCC MYA-4626 / FGSC 10389) TaxID=936046 RepID=UPI00029F6F67|nr:hypothetical protein AGABI2DRAFT_123026 [Agaricus bisporus var. bisporus H97]EKV42303.1 hypothetical protein AGABI2DRAFT_123026 [Agaricus bisporus var. bisporus H97]
MSVYYHTRLADQDPFPADLTRILTPWNYLSVSPVPQKYQRTHLLPCSDSPRTFLDTPSPRSLVAQDLSRTPVLLESDADYFLQSTPFERQFVVSVSPGWLQPLQEVSPVVRASSSLDVVAPSPRDVSVSPALELRYPVPVPDPSSDGESESDDDNGFSSDDGVSDADAEGEDDDEENPQSTIYQVMSRENSFLRRLHVVTPASPVVLSPPRSNTIALQSPCKISPQTLSSLSFEAAYYASTSIRDSFVNESDYPAPPSSKRSSVLEELAYPVPSSPKEPLSVETLAYPEHLEDGLPLRSGDVRTSLPDGSPPVTPEQACSASLLSPLTPLTPLTPPVTLTLRIPILPTRRTTRLVSQKRRLSEEMSTPYSAPSKRARLSRDTSIRRKSVVSDVVAASPPPSAMATGSALIYSTRSFPQTIIISPKFPLFYRRYPISSYFQPPEFSSPLVLFNLRDPGGTYNHPRSVFDLYTPRFVKGKGTGKLGLCPICVEPTHRGGENKKNWLAMKFSAFKW